MAIWMVGLLVPGSQGALEEKRFRTKRSVMRNESEMTASMRSNHHLCAAIVRRCFAPRTADHKAHCFAMPHASVLGRIKRADWETKQRCKFGRRSRAPKVSSAHLCM